jgi:Fe2+ transport system protein FeoA
VDGEDLHASSDHLHLDDLSDAQRSALIADVELTMARAAVKRFVKLGLCPGEAKYILQLAAMAIQVKMIILGRVYPFSVN